MDTRRLLTTIVIVGAVMLAYPYISDLWNGKKPPAAVAPTTTQSVYPAIATQPAGSEAGAKPATFRLGDPTAASKDKVAITINNVTADIDEVQLNVNDYAEYALSREHPNPEPLTLLKYRDGMPRAFATLRVCYTTPDGVPHYAEFLAKQFVWEVLRDPKNPYEARLRATLQNNGAPALEITKTFRVDPHSYEVYISHDVRNLTKQPLKVQVDQMGAIDLPVDVSQRDDRFYHAAGLNSTDRTITPKRFNLGHAELHKWTSDTKEVGSFLGHDPLEWIASSGTFFVAVVRPLPETGAPAPFQLRSTHKIPVATHIATANIDRIADASDPSGHSAAMRLIGNAIDLPPGMTRSLPLTVYLGPKKQEILQGNINAPDNTIPYFHAVFHYGTIIQLTSACYSFLPIDSLAYYLLWFLDLLKASVAFGNYGVAIILLVLLVKTALHPLTRKSQVNMAVMGKKMKDIQPLIEANKKKYAKDKQKQNEEMMKIYREKKVNPAGGLMGCLPMLIQTPIWIAVWEGLRTDINLRHAVFIHGWINDLSAPDATIVFHHAINIPLLSMLIGPLHALNILPLLLGIVVFLQMKVQTASQPKAADPQQAQMQKMSQYMVLIFPLFLYSYPSGINLYYFASTLGGLVDTYFVRKSLKRKGILPTNVPTLPTHEETATKGA